MSRDDTLTLVILAATVAGTFALGLFLAFMPNPM